MADEISTVTTDQGATPGPTSFSDPSLKWGPDEPSGGESPTPSTPASSEQAAPQGEQATPAATVPSAETPRDGAQQPEAGQTPGPIPFDRHQAVVDRMRSEHESRVARVAWAEELQRQGLSPDQVRDALDGWSRIDRDPVGFLEKFYEQLSLVPALAPQMRSMAARILGNHRPQAEDQEPQPDLQDRTTGQTAYSTDQLRKWQEWKARQPDPRIENLLSRVAPLEQERATREQEQQVREAAASIYTEAYETETKQLEELAKLPYFTENKAAMRDYLRETADAEGNYTKKAQDAYIHVLVNRVLPALSQAERSKVLTELKTNAAAGKTTVNPRTGAAAAGGPITSFNDPRLQW